MASPSLVKKSTAIYVVIGLIAAYIAVNLILISAGVFVDKDGKKLDNLTVLGIILAAGLSLGMYSFLYADNPVFKLCEHIYLGISVGYMMTVVFYEQLMSLLFKPLFAPAAGDKPDLFLIIPFAFGLCMLARFIPKYAWVSRYAFALIVGYGAGLAIPSVINAYLFKQSQATIINFASSESAWEVFCNFVIFAGVVCVLVYFFFSVRHEGPFKPVAKTGTYFIMISFGASFGFTVMARISLLIGRVMFLLVDWLHVASPPGT